MRIERVGRYEVIETLARGGMGVVYKARDPLIDRTVAVKTLGFGLSPIEADAFRKRFAREAKSAGRLSHPNIVTIHDMGESDDGAYIAMEFLEGHSLREVLDSGVVLPPARIADIACDVAEGLAFAHDNGVVHCDIKPANVMVLADGRVKITDFGIAMLPTGSRTFAGNVLGSPRYISPEQIVGRPVDARSDLFSLGAVLYEMLTGVPPFAGESIDEILYQVVNHKPEPPSQRNRSIPVEFDAIVERAMAKDPDHRYESAREMAAALRALGGRSTAMVPSAPSAGSRPAVEPGATTVSLDVLDAGSPRGRHPLRYAALALVAIVALAFAWRALRPIDDDSRVATASANANASNALPLRQPSVKEAQPAANAPPPAVIPPLATTVEPPPPEPASPRFATAAGDVVVRVPDAARAPASDARALARLALAISPWGEVYVDGRKRGVAPPLTELRLPPGKYEVEIRNTTFAPHRETVELFADAPARVRHKFRVSAARAIASALCAALVLGACATADDKPAVSVPKEAAPPPQKPAAAAPAPRPKPPPPEPAPPPEPPKTVTRSLGQDELAKGVKSYEDADYDAAAKQLQAALDLGLAVPSERVLAHKHLAFIACVGKRIRACRSEFRNAFAADPAFDLAPAEAGHPMWGPVFRSVKAELKRASKAKPASKAATDAKAGTKPKR